ncbi:carbohydrate kinase family protein [Thermus filiformis]|uniref:Fructokinase n=1 Tax=Thermus filiformis TaxID=276 RepID=A0A0A2WRS5_THEFI|nr:carbohydrate kinase [Thermus filiformis]KGQ22871.1 fructokinase [Thermus filiformis]
MFALVGEVLVDLVREGGEGLFLRGALGGSSLNTAAVLARMGAEVVFFGEVGSDWVADWARAALPPLEAHLQTHPAPMPLALAEPDERGNARYSFHRPFTEPFRPPVDRLGSPAWFHFGSLYAFDPRTEGGVWALLRAAHRAGSLVSLDPNLRAQPDEAFWARFRAYLPFVHLLKLSLEDARLLFPEDPFRVRALGVPLVVLTLGEEGAVAWGPKEVRIPGRKVEVVDTIGAGDTFTAALLFLLHQRGLGAQKDLAFWRGEGLEEALEGAVELSALACTVRGAGLPEEGFSAWKRRWLDL